MSLLANLIFGLAVSAILVFLCGPIYRMMSVPEEIFDEAVLYIRIIGAGMVLQAVYLTFTAFFRSCQLMKQTMLVSVLVNVMNIGCNALLINGLIGLPALGVAGAAISSGLSRLVGVVVIALLFRRYFGKGRYLRLLPEALPEDAVPRAAAHRHTLRRRVHLLQPLADLHPGRLQQV